MSYAPAPLLELQSFMQQQTGLPLADLGVVGDLAHDGGYHCGWDRRNLDDKGVLHDYSWQESTRDSSHKTNAARAFDCGMFPRLREMSIWMVQQCQQGAPDTSDIREIIYSPDGVNVLRWDRLKIRGSGDSSHLTHTHFSFFADAESRDKLGLFQRFFNGGKMQTEGQRNVGYMIQNGMVGVEEPVLHIPAEDGYKPINLTNPFAVVLKALVEGTDAKIPPFAAIGARNWVNGTAARLDALEATLARVEAKLDTLLAKPPGAIDPEAIRPVVRQELDRTGFRVI